MSDQPPDWIAQLDQALAGVGDLAKVIVAYHRALVDAGMPREEALHVVIGWQTAMLHAPQQEEGDDS